MCRMWARETGLRSGEVGKTGDTQGQTYPLIQIEGLWGAGQREEEEEQIVNDPRSSHPSLPPI